MVGSGNDFVVIDNRKRLISNASSLARELCQRQTGIGADGLLLLEGSRKADFKVQVLNSDGSEAEACGNGFRCVALLASEELGLPKRQRFETVSGILEAEVNGHRVRVRLSDPVEWKGPRKIEVSGRSLHYYFIRVGVPHVVIFVEGLNQIPVGEIGKAIRFHERFKPAGTNVNFVELAGRRSLAVRTYERGVEEETLACGTGSAASAVASARLGYASPPIEVKTRGGEILTVDFTRKRNEIRNLYLAGNAQLVFTGTWRT